MLSARWNMLHYTTPYSQLCTEVAVIVPIMNGGKLPFVMLGRQIGRGLQHGSLEEIYYNLKAFIICT